MSVSALARIRALPLLAALWPVAAAWPQAAPIGVAPVELDQDYYLFDTAELHPMRVDVVLRGLTRPYSLAFLPNGDALIAERGGALRLVRGATATDGRATLAAEPVPGTPVPPGVMLGGLHDLALHPDFARNRLVYFSYNRPGDTIPNSDPPQRAIALMVARGRFDDSRLVDVEDIFDGGERAGASGSRIAFGVDGLLYVTSGAPFSDEAQRVDNVYGKVLRLNDDGSVPADNPFVGTPEARAEVFTLGHRDQLGLTVHPVNGAVLAAEHGPQGGDKVNLIQPGRNYGWPEYSFGREYDGPMTTARPLGENTEPPLILWIPSIAPTGMTFYVGDRIPAWRGNLFVGSARRGQIPRTGGLERVVVNEDLEELRRESLLTQLHQRIRDVRQGPDGLLYVITDEANGALLRLSPGE
jgi:aldose sugar dehydrogenase